MIGRHEQADSTLAEIVGTIDTAEGRTISA